MLFELDARRTRLDLIKVAAMDTANIPRILTARLPSRCKTTTTCTKHPQTFTQIVLKPIVAQTARNERTNHTFFFTGCQRARRSTNILSKPPQKCGKTAEQPDAAQVWCNKSHACHSSRQFTRIAPKPPQNARKRTKTPGASGHARTHQIIVNTILRSI